MYSVRFKTSDSTYESIRKKLTKVPDQVSNTEDSFSGVDSDCKNNQSRPLLVITKNASIVFTFQLTQIYGPT